MKPKQQHIVAFIDPNTKEVYFVSEDDTRWYKDTTCARVFATKQGARQFIGRRNSRAAWHTNWRTRKGFDDDIGLEWFGEEQEALTTAFKPLSEHFHVIPITITPDFSGVK